MPRFGAFTLLTHCRCGRPVPFNRPALDARCDGCGANVQVLQGILTDLLLFLDNEHDRMADGASSRRSWGTGPSEVSASYARMPPRCDRCGATTPVDLPEGSERDLSCSGCGEAVHIAPPPQWMRKEVPTAQLLYTAVARADHSAAAAPANVAVGSASVLSCPKCGGTLPLHGDLERVIRCHFCAADVFLSDEVWRGLHPVRRVRQWFVRFDGITMEQRERDRREARLRAAADSTGDAEALGLEPTKTSRATVKARRRAFGIALIVLSVALIGGGVALLAGGPVVMAPVLAGIVVFLVGIGLVSS